MLRFRPYHDNLDAPQLVLWLNTPHVYAWWGRERLPESIGGQGTFAASLDQVYQNFGSSDPDTHYYIIEHDDQPIGLIQWCRVDDYEGYPEMLGVSEVVGIDLLIGSLGATGRGIGTQVIKQFTCEIALPQSGLSTAVADPETANVASCRAFEKAGYRPIKTFVGEGGHQTQLMLYETPE